MLLFINGGTIYTSDTSNKGKDAAFVCTDDDNVSSCDVIVAPTITTTIDYYVGVDKKLIKCTNGGCESREDAKIKPQAYISITDTTHKTLIICSAEANCEEEDMTNDLPTKGPLYFIDATDNKKIITCTDAAGCVSSDRSSNLAEGNTIYFIDGTNFENIIECKKSTGCTGVILDYTDPDANTGPFIDANDNSKTIVCVQGKPCISSKSKL